MFRTSYIRAQMQCSIFSDGSTDTFLEIEVKKLWFLFSIIQYDTM